MTRCLRVSQLLLSMAYFCQSLATIQAAHGQTLSTGIQQGQNTQSTQPQSSLGTTPTTDKGLQLRWNAASYDSFLTYVCEEDDLIHEQTQGDKQQTIYRIYYVSAIGISKGEEQTMLAILLDECHRFVQNKKQYKEAREQIDREYGADQSRRKSHPEFTVYAKSYSTILNETVARLERSLGAEASGKVDAYVSREFALGPHPLSTTPKQQEPTPFPVNVRYLFFIHHVAAEDARVQRETQEGRQVFRQDYSQVAHFPQGEEQPMLTIVLEAFRRLTQNEHQTPRVSSVAEGTRNDS
jgi:cell division septum initiation protein DivIVA